MLHAHEQNQQLRSIARIESEVEKALDGGLTVENLERIESLAAGRALTGGRLTDPLLRALSLSPTPNDSINGPEGQSFIAVQRPGDSAIESDRICYLERSTRNASSQHARPMRSLYLPSQDTNLVDYLIGYHPKEIRGRGAGQAIAGRNGYGRYEATFIPIYAASKSSASSDPSGRTPVLEAIRVRALTDSPDGPRYLEIDIAAEKISKLTNVRVVIEEYLKEYSPRGAARARGPIAHLRDHNITVKNIDSTIFHFENGSSFSTIDNLEALDVRVDSSEMGPRTWPVPKDAQVAVCQRTLPQDLHYTVQNLLDHPVVLYCAVERFGKLAPPGSGLESRRILYCEEGASKPQ